MYLTPSFLCYHHWSFVWYILINEPMLIDYCCLRPLFISVLVFYLMSFAFALIVFSFSWPWATQTFPVFDDLDSVGEYWYCVKCPCRGSVGCFLMIRLGWCASGRKTREMKHLLISPTSGVHTSHRQHDMTIDTDLDHLAEGYVCQVSPLDSFSFPYFQYRLFRN